MDISMLVFCIYCLGFVISWPLCCFLTVSGKMSFCSKPAETYGEVIIEAFLASTIWPCFLFILFVEGTPKIKCKKL